MVLGVRFMRQNDKSEISREKIIETATKEFNNYGYYGASVRRICRDGGFTNGRLFYHYKNKAELFLGCVESCYELMSEHLERFRFDYYLDLEQNLFVLYDWQCEFWLFNSDKIHLFAESRLTPIPEIKDGAHSSRYRSYMSKLKSILREISALYYPNDLARQSAIIGAYITITDYAYLSFGISNTDTYTNLTDWIQIQKKALRKVLKLFLHGFYNTDFPVLEDDSTG